MVFESTTQRLQELGIDFMAALERVRKVATKTPITYNRNLSKKYQCEIYLKREDLQIVRSYKLRGAYNMLSTLPPEQLINGVVCASAGNHAQGFAYSCNKMKIKGVVFMPVITSKQKIKQTRMFGEDAVEIQLVGDTFDDCAIAARAYTQQHNMTFIPPFENIRIIEGQATVGLEIIEEMNDVDVLILPVGGGGLASGVGLAFKTFSPATYIIGVEPEGAPSMKEAFKAGHPVLLPKIDPFVDGAAVKRVGDLTYSICSAVLDEVELVPEGKICSTILQLYNEEAIVVEPAGALSIAALDRYSDFIKGKKVVCIVSGSNNDIDRMPEIKERSLQFEGLKHYFLINFAQRPGSLKEFVNNVLGPNDDITRFEYTQKTNKTSGPAIVGIELHHSKDYQNLIENMHFNQVDFKEINKDDSFYGYLIS